MTAKHGCGFLLWPTDTILPDGSPYDYCVGKERSAIKFDLIGEFAKVRKETHTAPCFLTVLNFLMEFRCMVYPDRLGTSVRQTH